MTQWCEEHGWEIPPPPPNREVMEGFWGSIETSESKRLHWHWQTILDSWSTWMIERRRAEVAALDAENERLHGPSANHGMIQFVPEEAQPRRGLWGKLVDALDRW